MRMVYELTPTWASGGGVSAFPSRLRPRFRAADVRISEPAASAAGACVNLRGLTPPARNVSFPSRLRPRFRAADVSRRSLPEGYNPVPVALWSFRSCNSFSASAFFEVVT